MADIRVGGAYVQLSSQSSQYVAGVNQAIAANRRLNASYGAFNANLVASNALFRRFGQSVQASLLATAAYAAGVGAVTAALRGITTGFIEYDRGLIRISKTTGIAGDELERLGRRIVAIGTTGSGGQRALGILRQDLFSIAEAAGQAGIDTSRGIEQLTRASAALQISSNLIGTEAVRALTRYLQVTGQSIDQVDRVASAYTALGNNIVGTEAEISRFSVRIAQNLSAVGQASDAVILGISATLLEAGVEMEAAGSALQRTQASLIAASRDPLAFADAIRRGFDGTEEEFEALRQRIQNGQASIEDYDEALLGLLRTFQQIPVGDRRSFLADVIGGGEANVRNIRTIAVLANRYDRLTRNIRISNEALDEGNAHYEEASRAADSYASRLRVVANQLEEQGTAIGSVIVPGLVTLAENFRLLEAAALATGVALATGFATRRIRAIRETARATREAAAEQRNLALAAQNTARTDQSAAARRVRAATAGIRVAPNERRAQTELTRAYRQYGRATAEVTRTTNELAAAQARVAATTRTMAQRIRGFSAGLLGFLGGPLGLFLAALAAAPLIVAAFRDELSAFDQEIQDITQSLRDAAAAQQLEASGLTELGADAQRARELLLELRNEQTRLREELSQGLQGALAPTLPGIFARRIAQAIEELQAGADELSENAIEGIRLAGLGDALDELLESRDQAAELAALLEQLGLAADEGGQQAAAAAVAVRQEFEALPPSILRAIQAVRQFNQSIDDANFDALREARFELDLVGLSRGEQIYARLVEAERQRLVVFQRSANERALVAQENRDAAADDVRALTTQRDSLAAGTEARKEAEAALAAAERRLETADAELAVALELRRLAAQRQVDEEEAAEIARTRLRQINAERVARRLDAPAPVADPDLSGARADAESRVIALRDRRTDATYNLRTAELARDASSEREAIRIRTRRDLTLEAIRAEREAEREGARINREIADARQRLLRVEEDIQAALAGEAREEATRRREESLNAERAALEGVQGAAGDLAGSFTSMADTAVGDIARVTDAVGALHGALDFGVSPISIPGLPQIEMGAEVLRELLEEQRRNRLRSLPLLGRDPIGERGPAASVDFGAGLRANRQLSEAINRILTDAFERYQGPRFDLQAQLDAATRQQALQQQVDSMVRELGPGIIGRLRGIESLLTDISFRGGGDGFGFQLTAGRRSANDRATGRASEFTEESFGPLADDVANALIDSLDRRVPTQVADRTAAATDDGFRDLIADCLPLDQFEDLKRRANEVFSEGGQFGELLDQAGEEVTQFADDAGDAITGFFRDVRELVEEQLDGPLPGPQSRTPPFLGLSRVVRAFEDQARRDEQRAREQARDSRETDTGRLLDGVQDLIERAQQAPTGIERQPSAGTREALDESAEFLRQMRELRRQQQEEPARLQPIALGAQQVGSTPVPHLLPAGEGINLLADAAQQATVELERLGSEVAQVVRTSARPPVAAGLPGGPGTAAGYEGLRDNADAVSDAVLDRRDNLREQVAVLEAAKAENEAYTATLSNQTEETERLIEAIADLDAQAHSGPFQRYLDEITRLDDALEELAVQGFRGLSAEIAQMVATGEADFQRLAQSIIQQLLEILIQARIVAPLIQALGLAGGGGGGGGALLPAGFTFFHEGGRAGSGGTRQPRPAGLRSDELFAVLQRGEVVLPRALAQRVQRGGYQDMEAVWGFIRSLPRYHTGGVAGARGGPSGGGDRPVRLELINQSNTNLEAVDNGYRIDADGAIQSVVLRDIRRNGPISQGLSQRFGVRPR